MNERALTFTSGDVTFEAALHEGDAPLVAVLLHPHPLYGGDMENHVVTTVASTLADAGATTLRYNSRGTGRSTGSFDGGAAERSDACAAALFAREQRPDASLLLFGYSFGASVAAAAAPDVMPELLVLVSPPARTIAATPSGPRTLVVTGEHDPVSPPDAARAVSEGALIIAGADHSWWPGVTELARVVGEFVFARRPA